MKQYIIILGLLTILFSCEKSDIPTYSAQDYIKFTKNLDDSTNFTFLFHPGVQSYDLALPLEISGIPVVQDKAYKIVVDTKLSTAIEGTHFSLPAHMVFRTGNVIDTCFIKLYKTADMKSNTYRIVLRLEPTTDFGVIGQIEYTVAIINVSDKVAKPDWWEGNVEWYYLGDYSDTKFQKFIEVTGISDLTDASDGLIRAYALQFTFWLQEETRNNRTVYDENGDPMETPFMI